MFIHVLYFVTICLSALMLYLNGRNIIAGDSTKCMSWIFKGGLLYTVCSYVLFILYPQQVYWVVAFPIGMLYATVLFMFHYLLTGRSFLRFYRCMIPFAVAVLAYIVIMFSPDMRYRFLHEYFVLVHLSSCIFLLVYAMWSAFVSDSGRKSKSVFGQHIPLLLCVSVTFGVMVMVMWVKVGNVEGYIFSALSSFILVLAYLAQSVIFHRKWNYVALIPTNGSVAIDCPDKVDFVIPKELILSYKLEIEKFVGSREYLAVDLNKDMFSERVNIPMAHISPFLRQVYGKGFNGFINELRVAYAAKELKREDLAYTMDDLGFICGFRSRASFYRNFIATFGCSPLQYRNAQLGTSSLSL